MGSRGQRQDESWKLTTLVQNTPQRIRRFRRKDMEMSYNPPNYEVYLKYLQDKMFEMCREASHINYIQV